LIVSTGNKQILVMDNRPKLFRHKGLSGNISLQIKMLHLAAYKRLINSDQIFLATSVRQNFSDFFIKCELRVFSLLNSIDYL
jgi:hypothetical protein